MATQIEVTDLKIEEYEFVDAEKHHLFSVKFFPSDLGIVERHKDFVDWINNVDVSNRTQDEIFDITNELRVELDKFLGVKDASDICDLMNPFTPQPDGRLYIEVAMDNVFKLIESQINVRMQRVDKRISKHTAKYYK